MHLIHDIQKDYIFLEAFEQESFEFCSMPNSIKELKMYICVHLLGVSAQRNM
jgi:hypothetical protein